MYTRVAPKPGPSPYPTHAPLATLQEDAQDTTSAGSKDPPTPQEKSQPASVASSGVQEAPVTLPLNAAKSDSQAASGTSTPSAPADDSLSRLNGPKQDGHGQDSQVLNDTLNVINEHITNLRSPTSQNAIHTGGTDSGSEYSIPLGSRMSYIHGEETDEEDGGRLTRAEVESWSPDQVAEHLFVSGVESHHCEVFKSQEISGEVMLGMDQSSLFINAFDLGSVGRRLKTWHRIKALQDEVNGATRRTTGIYGSDVGSEDVPRARGRTSTLTNSISNPPMSVQTRRLSSNQTPPSLTPNSVSTSQGSPSQFSHYKRPSAASIRDLHHSRRHSSTDYQVAGPNTPKIATNGTFPLASDGTHKKQPSFDRNWSMGGAFASNPQRPLSQAGGGSSNPDLQDSAVELDRGYFSGTEVEGRGRNVLRKRDSVRHSRNSSYTEEQRVRSATALSRHSRFGSDSYRESAPASASQRYFGIQPGVHKRTGSTKTTDSARPMPIAKDGPSPTVTKLGVSNRDSDRSSRPHTPAKDGDWLSSLVHKPGGKTGSFGIRAISDNLGLDRKKGGASSDLSKELKGETALASPARTGSSTPSAGPSFDMGSSEGKTPGAVSASNSVNKNKGKKGKKETSAYTRGLLKIGPKEAMQGADYCGWMRKKSSNLMTTWKPRFFVLKGRRLSYYYSEDDAEEKGLIDISFHRVLPADNEKLTGLHATLTSAVGGSANLGSSLTSPGDTEELQKGDDAVFIFKLVPPRAGLSRAVNFTKPTVHYFAVQNLKQGRLWMAALMKATIDRDDTQPITTTYQQKTISLAKAKQMRQRPPALMNLEEKAEDEQTSGQKKPSNGLGISVDEKDEREGDDVPKPESANVFMHFGDKLSATTQPPPSA